MYRQHVSVQVHESAQRASIADDGLPRAGGAPREGGSGGLALRRGMGRRAPSRLRHNLSVQLLVLLGALVLGPGCTGIVYDGENSNQAPDSGQDAGADSDADAQSSDPCDGVGCGVGTCVVSGNQPTCQCPEDFHPEGLTCIADEPPDPCETTQCGVNAYCDHGVCICQDGYEGNPVEGCTSILTQDELCRAELVSIAMAELGYCEGTDARPYMEYQPGLWCYDFVAWVYQQSSCSPPSPLSLPHRTVGSLPAGWRPLPGDLIKFTYQHYGMVASLSTDGQIVTTVEGNVSYCVASRSITDSSVEYYGTLEGVW